MKPLRVALVVSEVERRGAECDGHYPRTALRRLGRDGAVDLISLPEMFRACATRDDVVPTVRRLAEDLGTPVLAGVWCVEEQMQCAGYWNPRASRGETEQHFYAKHATSVRLAYELDDYAEIRERLFDPIRLCGRKIGVQLCHDMFFGLVGVRWVARGADVLIDLTGNNVNLAKWTNVVAARSLEHDVPFLCTMADWKFVESNVAAPIAFRSGRRIEPQRTLEKAGQGRVVIVDVSSELGARVGTQAHTPKQYVRFKIGLNTSAAADVHVSVEGAVDGRAPSFGEWQERVVAGARIGILTLPMSVLRDPLCIHRVDQIESPFEHHVVVFVGTVGEVDAEDAILLAKLRAIEHRMAIGLLTPSTREMLKTNRYKNIQRFESTNGVFGLDDVFLAGTYASARETGVQGIRRAFLPEYRALAEDIPRHDATARTQTKSAEKSKRRETSGSKSAAQGGRREKGFLSRIGASVRKWLR